MLMQSLVTFCRVVDEGSFTRAAQSMDLSQPTVTKQVQRLEEEMGAALIDRSHRTLMLTPAGEIVYIHGRRILNTVSHCRTAVETLTMPGRGHLSIGAVFTIALYTLPRLLEEYMERHKLVTVHVKSGTNREILDLLLHNEVNVGLTTVPVNHEQIITRPLFDDRVVLVCAPGTPWANEQRIEAAQLTQIPMISYEKRSQFRGFVDAHFQAAGIAPDVVMEFDSHEAVKTMVKLGLGVAMAPYSAVRDDLESGRLVTLVIEDFPEIGRMSSLIVRHEPQQSEALANFITLVDERFPPVVDASDRPPGAS